MARLMPNAVRAARSSVSRKAASGAKDLPFSMPSVAATPRIHMSAGSTYSWLMKRASMSKAAPARYQLPAVYPYRYNVAGGGLISLPSQGRKCAFCSNGVSRRCSGHGTIKGVRHEQ
jgi:hypothetical protein